MFLWHRSWGYPAFYGSSSAWAKELARLVWSLEACRCVVALAGTGRFIKHWYVAGDGDSIFRWSFCKEGTHELSLSINGHTTIYHKLLTTTTHEQPTLATVKHHYSLSNVAVDHSGYVTFVPSCHWSRDGCFARIDKLHQIAMLFCGWHFHAVPSKV